MNEQEAIEAIKKETFGSMEAAYWIVVAYKAQKQAELARKNADLTMGQVAQTMLEHICAQMQS